MANLLWYGIDLGTRTNLVALKHIEENKTEPVTEIVEFPRYGTAYPSYVYADEEKVLSGRMAEDAYHDQSFEELGSSYYMIWEPKMILAEAGGEDKEIRIGKKTWYVSDLLARIFSDLLEEAEKHFHRLGVKHLMIGVPVDYPDRCKEAIVSALCKSSFYSDMSPKEVRDSIYFAPEPVAASLCYSEDIADRENVLMFDFGGGTLDITIMDLHGNTEYEVRPHKVLAKGRFLHDGKNFAGINVDYMMFQLYLDQVPREELYKAFSNSKAVSDEDLYKRMRQDPECGDPIYKKLISAKEELSAVSADEVRIPKKSGYKDNGTRYTIPAATISRAELEKKLMPILEEISQCIEGLFETPKMLELGITKDSIDRVLLAGGTSMIPCVQEMLCTMFGASKVRLNQQTSATQYVVEGLAHYGYQMQFLKKKEEIFEDLIESDYGYLDYQGVNQVVLERGLPVSRTRIDEDDPDEGTFVNVLASDKSSSFITVQITQNAKPVGKVTINEIGSGSYRLYYEIDLGKGWLNVRLYDKGLRKWLNRGGEYSRITNITEYSSK